MCQNNRFAVPLGMHVLRLINAYEIVTKISFLFEKMRHIRGFSSKYTCHSSADLCLLWLLNIISELPMWKANQFATCDCEISWLFSLALTCQSLLRFESCIIIQNLLNQHLMMLFLHVVHTQ